MKIDVLLVRVEALELQVVSLGVQRDETIMRAAFRGVVSIPHLHPGRRQVVVPFIELIRHESNGHGLWLVGRMHAHFRIDQREEGGICQTAGSWRSRSRRLLEGRAYPSRTEPLPQRPRSRRTALLAAIAGMSTGVFTGRLRRGFFFRGFLFNGTGGQYQRAAYTRHAGCTGQAGADAGDQPATLPCMLHPPSPTRRARTLSPASSSVSPPPLAARAAPPGFPS